MIPVKYTDTTTCIYSDYGCRNITCPLNKLHKSVETHFGITDVPSWCLNTIDMCSDESLNSVVRDWIDDMGRKAKVDFVPQEVRDIIECKKPKILPPLFRWMRGENVKVGPGVVIPDNWKQPRIKNFVWHIRKHTLSFLYKIYVFRICHIIYSKYAYLCVYYKYVYSQQLIYLIRISRKIKIYKFDFTGTTIDLSFIIVNNTLSLLFPFETNFLKSLDPLWR